MVILSRRTTQRPPLSLQRGLNQKNFYRKTCPLKKDTVAFSRKNNVSFGRRMTPAIREAIENADVEAISAGLAKRGIETDFRGNKVIAWCCNEAIGVMADLNERFGCGLTLPNGIFVKDFGDLTSPGPIRLSPGFANFLPTQLDKTSGRIYGPGTVFFNSYNRTDYAWNNLDKMSKLMRRNGGQREGHFLEPILHEFAHIAHGHRLSKGLSLDGFCQKLCSLGNENTLRRLQANYGKTLVANICSYGATNPFEAVACDMAGRVVKSLDPKTLRPRYNPLKDTSYDNSRPVVYHTTHKIPAWRKVCEFLGFQIPDKKLTQELLRGFWDGCFEFSKAV